MNIAKMICMTAAGALLAISANARERWTTEQANAWYAKQPFMAGMNYMPANSINQLEMWQKDTFDPARIDLELGWAQDLGFNAARVFLHDLLWKEDAAGLYSRMEKFLEIADKHNIRVLFVFFDACWYPNGKLGKQPAPTPHAHNSGWLQSPNAEVLKNPAVWGYLEEYVKSTVSRFKDDKRILGWDVYNEPTNPGRLLEEYFGTLEVKNGYVAKLLPKSFEWALSANPSQPVTAAVWRGGKKSYTEISDFDKIKFDNSDIISFHAYAGEKGVDGIVKNLERFGRPLWCTEYMARKNKSTFDPVLGYFKKEKIAAFCWGFVNGKTQTIYPWDSNPFDSTKYKKYEAAPELWFHDVLNYDGTPYKQEEADYIRKVMKN